MLYFLLSTLVLTLYIDVVLSLSINDMHTVSNKLTFITYADDTTLTAPMVSFVSGSNYDIHWFPSRSSVLIYMYVHSLYELYVTGRIYNGSVIQYWRSCTPSRSIGECAVPGLNATFCFLWFTNCVLLFDKNLILGCVWLLVFVLNNILILGIWCSTIPHLPGCFCPWTFFENIGFNTVLTDPFMSHLATQPGYSAGEFQALQLIVLAAFGVVD